MATGSKSRELRLFWRQNALLLLWIAIFSFFVNALMLTGPLYMLQVYERVLGSRSEETLIALSLLVAFLFLMMGILDFVRGRVSARIGARLQSRFDERVFRASLKQAAREGGAQSGLSDLEAVQRLLSSPVFLALFDIPAIPVFLLGIFIFHPWLGWLAVIGGAVLVAIAVLNQLRSASPLGDAGQASGAADRMASQMQERSEMIASLGMTEAVLKRWMGLRQRALGDQIAASDRLGGYTTLTKTLRLFLQSAMLGLGGYLVLQGEMRAGAMIAASILMGRALAPIEMVIGQWQMVYRARQGQVNLRQLLDDVMPEPERLSLPRPAAKLEVTQLAVVPPGQSAPVLRGVNFRVLPGQAVGVIGMSGSGKSTLAKAITGVWRPAAGQIRLDGSTLDQYTPERLGSLIGYLPQQVNLFEGSLAENIARLATEPDAEAVVAAAHMAAADRMIRAQNNGYETRIGPGGAELSGGQVQRVGLARALYGDPVLLVLDEPNSNLDNEGSDALNRSIRAMKADGRSVLIMAHRPSAIQECEMLLVLDNGTQRAFGPRDEVMQKVLSNPDVHKAGPGGVS